MYKDITPVTNLEIQEEFGFIIEDAEFRKNYMHLLTKEFLGKWIDVFGKPTEYDDQAEYYLRLAFGLVGYQIGDSIKE